MHVLAGQAAEARNELNGDPVEDSIQRPVRLPMEAFAMLTEARGPKPSLTQRIRIFDRDGWRCRYCHRKVVVPPVLRLLRHIYPDFKGVGPGDSMPKLDTDCGVGRVYPNLDHIHLQSYNGSNRDENLVTACQEHNEHNGNRPVCKFALLRSTNGMGCAAQLSA
jgi:5-methylcytosine-specific restriction endonuclease McrA